MKRARTSITSPASNHPLSRRRFIQWSSVSAVGLVVAGCGSDDSAGSESLDTAAEDPASGGTVAEPATGAGQLGSLSFQMGWVQDVQYGGTYLARQNGYFTDVGFDGLDLRPGGPDVSPDPVVISGGALIGVSNPDVTAIARNEGATLKVIGARYHVNPFEVLSLAETPLNEPADLVGKTIAVDTSVIANWNAFLTANDLDPDNIEIVPANFDLSLLTSGSVAGYLGYVTAEAGSLRQMGLDPVQMRFQDFNYASVSETYIATEDSIANDRERLVAALGAELMGWQDFRDDPAAAAQLTVDEYGTQLGLDMEGQTAVADTMMDILVSPTSDEDGLFMISDADQAVVVASLGLAGIETSAAELFDLSPLSEAYDKYPGSKDPNG